jgi:hypothetical protein
VPGGNEPPAQPVLPARAHDLRRLFWALLGAGIWGQLLEGSPKLLRPFGWYGGMVGGLVGALTAPVFGTPVIPLLAGMALAAPWIQMLGRLRCLVQGCCHGGPAPDGVGGIARGKDKEPLARQLGASVYIDSQAQDPAAELLARSGVRSMNETFPLERASDAYDRMMSGKARFRVVLTIGR